MSYINPQLILSKCAKIPFELNCFNLSLQANITDWLGYQNRWWFYPGNLDIALPVGLPPDITVEYVELAGINTVIITPKGESSVSV